jgi:hypothetical protein
LNLFDIAAEYRQACEVLADLDMDAQTVADTLEGMSGDLEVKAANVVGFTRNLEALSVAIKAEEERLSGRRKAIERRVAALQAYTLNCLQLAGIQKLEGPRFKITVRDNPPAVDVFDAAQIPVEFMRQPEPPPPTPDKTAIKAALKAGKDVPGAKLTQGKRLAVD